MWSPEKRQSKKAFCKLGDYMAKDIGEEIVGAWLRVIEGCDFVQYNVPTRSKQGEIDVVGLNLQTQVVYICEVATHTGGLQYTNLKERLPNNYEKLVQKFSSDIDYAEIYLKSFKKRFMLWSPIVRLPSKENTKHNAFLDLARIQESISQRYQIELELIINESYLEKINMLKAKAEVETAASEYPVFRLLQILGSLERNVTRLKKRGIDSQSTIQALRNGLV